MLETIKGNCTIKEIFEKNRGWFCVKRKNIRPAVKENVEKILACGDKDKLGWNRYECPDCEYKHYVAHTCKSRFCNSCGKVMTDNWISKSEKEFFNAPYHHIVFSPPSELWLFFPGLPRVSSFAV